MLVNEILEQIEQLEKLEKIYNSAKSRVINNNNFQINYDDLKTKAFSLDENNLKIFSENLQNLQANFINEIIFLEQFIKE